MRAATQSPPRSRAVCRQASALRSRLVASVPSCGQPARPALTVIRASAGPAPIAIPLAGMPARQRSMRSQAVPRGTRSSSTNASRGSRTRCPPSRSSCRNRVARRSSSASAPRCPRSSTSCSNRSICSSTNDTEVPLGRRANSSCGSRSCSHRRLGSPMSASSPVSRTRRCMRYGTAAISKVTISSSTSRSITDEGEAVP